MRIPDYPSRDSEKWTQLDAWFSVMLAPEEPQLNFALFNNVKKGLPAHYVTALQAIYIQM